MTMLMVALALILIFAGGAAFIFSLNSLGSDELMPRLETFVSAPDEKDGRLSGMISIRTRELSGSLGSRILFPFFQKVGNLISGLTPTHSYDRIQRLLYVAGNPFGMGVREFFGARLVFVVLAFLLAYVLVQRSTNTLWILLSILAPGFILFLPDAWLHIRVQRRQDTIQKSLPDALDMLSVCAEAGLGFDQSLQRVSEHWKTPVAYELGRVVNEMEMGISRRDALRNLANRFDVTELSSFVAIILQSDKLGMSIADTLHSQADQMRVERRYRAQEQARKIPIKMLLPMTFFIFPALLVVLLAPAIPQLLALFGNL